MLWRIKRKNRRSICDRVTRALLDKGYGLWNRALNNVLVVYTIACFEGDLGKRVWTKFVVEQKFEDEKEVLQDALGNKSAQAVNKRVNSFLPLGDWHSEELFSWPLPIEGVLEFMLAERHGKKALSRGKALVAVRLVCAISQTRDSTFSIKQCERTTIPETFYDGNVASLL